MEQLENMEEIEALQTELGQFLVSMMPVPWEKICFYAKCESGTRTIWYAFEEKDTGAICTREFFWRRYEQYPTDKWDTTDKLMALTKALYLAYLASFGNYKIWSEMYYTLNVDRSINIEFEYGLSDGNIVQLHDTMHERFFGVPYKCLKGKYPATE